jgi:hypothetical protein
VRRLTAVMVLSLFVAFGADARIGGGDSYSSSSSGSSSSSSYSSSGHDSSSSSSSGSSSSSSGGSSLGSSDPADVAMAFLMFTFFGIFLGGAAMIAGAIGDDDRVLTLSAAAPAASAGSSPATDLSPLRRFDANFSEIVFADFCYSLFARVHEARGAGRLDQLAPFIAAAVRDGMKRHSQGVSSVDHIVIGSFSVAALRGLNTPAVRTEVVFEANYTETTPQGAGRWYVRERWMLERARDILSPAPEQAHAEHCPKCGAPLQTRTDGACLHCGSVIADGTFQWFVRSIAVQEKTAQPPRLGGFGLEVGTERATVIQPWIARAQSRFLEQHPGFTWEELDRRVRHVATELQTAWTSRDWNRARPHETGALFQMHRYWIDEYLRQRVWNVIEQFQIGQVEIAKVTSDAFYDAITVRMFASGVDYTIDQSGNVVGGSREHTRHWSEYWTFIRGRAGAAADAKVCPNCGGPRPEGQTAICAYCGGRITTGDFPWVLSRIEQDESYRG